MLRQYTRHNYTFPEARANLLRIHVYYDDLTVTLIQQTGAYDVSSFIGTLSALIWAALIMGARGRG